jgi:hypothetical protein
MKTKKLTVADYLGTGGALLLIACWLIIMIPVMLFILAAIGVL